jgi:hypothetical protein
MRTISAQLEDASRSSIGEDVGEMYRALETAYVSFKAVAADLINEPAAGG